MFNKLYENIKDFMKNNWSYLLTFGIILAIFLIKIPYQVEMPGGIIDLNNRVTINGEEVEDTEGSFNMAYVSVVQGSIPYSLLSFIIPDWDLVKSSDVKMDNETVEEANKRDKLYLDQSKNYAIVAALETAGIKYEIKNKVNYVAMVSEDSKSDFKVGDHILEVDGKTLFDINELTDIISNTDVGDTLTFKVKRDKKEVEVNAEVYEDEDKHYIGIFVITNFDIDSELDVKITNKSSESGPSGGLMMALMTYNAITGKDLTNGKKIVGTGTISLDGTVGEIGGVKYKLMGAVKNKADVFLVPAGDNYEDALKTKEEKGYDIEIVSVETLKDAIEYLEGAWWIITIKKLL